MRSTISGVLVHRRPFAAEARHDREEVHQAEAQRAAMRLLDSASVRLADALRDGLYAHHLHGHAGLCRPDAGALVARGHDIVAVYTQPPRAGRPRPVRQIAGPRLRRNKDIPVRTPEFSRARPSRRVSGLDADAAVVVAYGQLLPRQISRRPALAASTSMPRCCRAGGAPRRSSAPSWPAMPRPASPSCVWAKDWTRAGLLGERVRSAPRYRGGASRSAGLAGRGLWSRRWRT